MNINPMMNKNNLNNAVNGMYNNNMNNNMNYPPNHYVSSQYGNQINGYRK
jgi:hypothetical protein